MAEVKSIQNLRQEQGFRMTGLQVRVPPYLRRDAELFAAKKSADGKKVTMTDIIRTWIMIGHERYVEEEQDIAQR